MNHATKTQATLDLILAILKLSRMLQVHGDRMGRDLDVTSSRWAFLGNVLTSDKPLTVSDMARRMSMKPQTVQRFADALREKGFIDLKDNPDHKRARHIHLTPEGKKVLGVMLKRELTWVETLVNGLKVKDVKTATDVITDLSEKIDL